ncbi:hypothetical protein HW554_13680 [Hymenobacter sp. P5342]|uniref:DDE Tnp4 domain-containing protein n=1 Tax=Hymenobacter lapidiphilus TaxID=2608003 RepID=A0A7Y7U789_9BACT|nr:hypothetical protein [Hymenobacter lapidiphilus]
MKNNLFCSPNKRVLFLSATYPGSVHDKAICDEEAYAFPEGIVLDQDAGYQGHQPANAWWWSMPLACASAGGWCGTCFAAGSTKCAIP